MKIAITGGIGSGKSSVCKYADLLGIPIYYTDLEAKVLMKTKLKPIIIETFGDDSYIDDEINKEKFNKLLFNDKDSLDKMNSIVGNEMKTEMSKWFSEHPDIALVESALIFEHKQEDNYDYIINVSCDLETKIKRITERDNISSSVIESKIKNQLTDDYRNKHSDFIIYNDKDIKYMENQFNKIIKNLRNEK